MNPGIAKIVSFPYCGGKKKLMTLISGNTFGASMWSDCKMIAPMLPEVSPVQKCPNCGKYYLEHKQPFENGDDYSFAKGEMTYQEWKEAYNQFLEEQEIDKTEFFMVRLWLIQAYNDCYYRKNQEAVNTQEEDFIAGIIKEFVEFHDGDDGLKPLIKAEFYREAGDMQRCAELLSEINSEELQGNEIAVYMGVKERMEAGDRSVFKLSHDEGHIVINV